jgi:hypothetical protein
MAAAMAISLVTAVYVVATTVADIARYHHMLPWWDGWVTVVDFQSIMEGTYRLSNLFSQHNEHRIAFPRLFELADFFLFRGTGWLPIVASLVMQIIGACVFVLASFSARSTLSRITLSCVAVSILFSATQMVNFSEQFQLTFLAVWALAGVSIGLFALAVGRHRAARSSFVPWLASSFALVLATYSAANGVLAGIAILGVALVMRAPLRLWLGSALVTVLLGAVYLRGYQSVAQHPSLLVILHDPAEFVLYIVTYLGCVAADLGLWTCAAIGLVGLALSSVAILYEAARRDSSVSRATMVGIMVFILLTAAMTSVGRVGFGLIQATSTRYATFVMVLWAAHAVYWPLLLIDRPLRVHNWLALAGSILVCATIGYLQTRNQDVLEQRTAGLDLLSAALMTGVVDEGGLLVPNFSPEIVGPLGEFLRQNKLSVFATLDARVLGAPVSNAFAIRAPLSCLGFLNTVQAIPDSAAGAYRVKGWAWDKERHAPVDRLLIADEAGHIVGYAVTIGNRPDTARAIAAADPRAPAYWRRGEPGPRTGWAGFAKLPHGGILRAFAELGGDAVCELGRLAVAAPA